MRERARFRSSRIALALTLCASLLIPSTAVAAGRFADDDESPHEEDIETIATAGVTLGCNPPANDFYCPDDPVTRGQMAAFLKRALRLAKSPVNAFTDDNQSEFENDIQSLAASGITQGCNPPSNDLYCPDDPVTRAQMAAFLKRALRLPASTFDAFTDDDESVFENDIQSLAAAGVTFGCNPPDNDLFCPDASVTRAQMASFLARAVPLDPVQFLAGGDIGARRETDRTMAKLALEDTDFLLALGDLSYSDVTPESAWCTYMKGYLGATYPVELLVGNHEDDDRQDGFIGTFAACLPDRMNSTGIYGVEYYFDVAGVMRVIMLGADNTVNGVEYNYQVGDPQYNWLSGVIDDARADGLEWVIVGLHKPCITALESKCDIGTDLNDLLFDKRVDLVLIGHHHTYQRSKQLRCAIVNVFNPACVVDDGSDGRYDKGAGSVLVINGLLGGLGFGIIDRTDPEFPYMASTMGRNEDLSGRGYLKIKVTEDFLSSEFVGSNTTFSDYFEIR